MKDSEKTKKQKKNNCVMHPEYEMMFFFEIKLMSILGMMVEEKQKSTTERLKRKKYIGVCRWEFSPIRKIKPRFPTKTLCRNLERERRGAGGVLAGLSDLWGWTLSQRNSWQSFFSGGKPVWQRRKPVEKKKHHHRPHKSMSSLWKWNPKEVWTVVGRFKLFTEHSNELPGDSNFQSTVRTTLIFQH